MTEKYPLNIPCIMIIDDDESVREALLLLMKSIKLTARAFASATEFIEQYQPMQRGCIISDIRMPGMSGLALQQELKQRNACQPLIFITGHGDIAMAVDAIKDGAFDFLTKPFRDQDLLDTIDNALEENAVRLAAIDQRNKISQRLESLTARERQVLDLVLAGQPNKLIAEHLHLSPRTVEVHRSHMMEKMQAPNATELIKLMQQFVSA